LRAGGALPAVRAAAGGRRGAVVVGGVPAQPDEAGLSGAAARRGRPRERRPGGLRPATARLGDRPPFASASLAARGGARAACYDARTLRRRIWCERLDRSGWGAARYPPSRYRTSEPRYVPLLQQPATAP